MTLEVDGKGVDDISRMMSVDELRQKSSFFRVYLNMTAMFTINNKVSYNK